MVSWSLGAKCCSIFSFTGLVFLLIIGSLLQNQPLYIKGPTDSVAAAQSCYQGALIYLGTFVASVAYWIFDSLKKKASAALSGNTSSIPIDRSNRQRIHGDRKYGAVALGPK
jgi:hypothetical protein